MLSLNPDVSILRTFAFVYYNIKEFKEVLIHQKKKGIFKENENGLMGQCKI